MRKILFRGKRAETQEWVEGDLLIDSCKDVSMRSNHCTLYYDIIPETVGQYTGLTDKNGKKIFEGDIVKNEYGYIGLIVMKACSYYIEWQSGNFSNDLYVFADSLEVIGNIHDNPELLEGVEK